MCFSPDGLKLALVLEQGDTARVIVWPTTDPQFNVANFRLTCKSPSRGKLSVQCAGLRYGGSITGFWWFMAGRLSALPSGASLGTSRTAR